MRVIDMHCDTISLLYEKQQAGETASILDYTSNLNLIKMKQGDFGLQNFALYTNLLREKKPLEYCLKLVDTFYQELEVHSDRIGIVRSFAEIDQNWKAGRMSAMLTMEEGGACQGELANLRNFYRLGVRMMTLTWNFPNELAFPNKCIFKGDAAPVCTPETERGLTETGIAFIQEMERLGMIIDIAHLGDAGIWDVFHHTEKPFVASHSNARAIATHPRNLTDEMIRALSERGGVIGINYYATFLKDSWQENQKKVGNIEDILRHMNYIKQVGGIGCIGLGSDFDGLPHAVEFVDGAGLPLLAEAMEQQGFTSSEIEAIFFGNALRVYRELL